MKASRKPSTPTIWVLRSEMISASPRALASIARVAMNGTIPPYAIRSPLMIPHPAPTASALNTMSIQCVSSAICWVANVVHQTEDRARIAPTERSMPPPVMTKVIPTLTTPMVAARRRIVSTLLTLANRSPAVITPTRQISASATTRPRLRPTLELRIAAQPVSVGTAACAACSTRTVSAVGSAVFSTWSTSGVVLCSLMRPFLPSPGRGPGTRRSRGPGPRGRCGPRGRRAPGRRGRAPPRPRWRPRPRRHQRRPGT